MLWANAAPRIANLLSDRVTGWFPYTRRNQYTRLLRFVSTNS